MGLRNPEKPSSAPTPSSRFSEEGQLSDVGSKIATSLAENYGANPEKPTLAIVHEIASDESGAASDVEPDPERKTLVLGTTRITEGKRKPAKG